MVSKLFQGCYALYITSTVEYAFLVMRCWRRPLWRERKNNEVVEDMPSCDGLFKFQSHHTSVIGVSGKNIYGEEQFYDYDNPYDSTI